MSGNEMETIDLFPGASKLLIEGNNSRKGGINQIRSSGKSYSVTASQQFKVRFFIDVAFLILFIVRGVIRKFLKCLTRWGTLAGEFIPGLNKSK